MLLTNSLAPSYRVEEERAITLPDTPGVYRVYTAVYDVITSERLPIAGTAETLGLLGSISVGG